MHTRGVLNSKKLRRTASTAGLWLACLSLASPGFGQETINVVNWAASDATGTFASGINSINGGAEAENTLLFTNQLIGQTLSIDLEAAGCPECLPAIDLGAGAVSDRKLELNATAVGTTFDVLATSESTPAPHDLLRVSSGHVTVVDLQLAGGDIDIASNASLSFRDNEEYGERNVGDVIKGGGKLVKEGSQTLILTGANTYSGGTELKQGKLEGDRHGLQRVFTFIAPEGDNEQAVLSFLDDGTSDQWNFTGSTTGPGKVEKNGQSTLVVSGATGLEHTGGTHIKQGILKGLASKLDSGPITVDAGSESIVTELYFDQTQPETFQHDISGSGSVRKSGSGTLTLSGTNTYSGGLLIDEGEVSGHAGSLPGDITFKEGAAGLVVNFTQTTQEQHNGTISGPGTIQKQGDSLLTLAGAVSQNVTTHVVAGSLRVESNSFAGDVTVDNQATIQFGQSVPVDEPYIYTETITGQGSFEMVGTGTVVLSSAQAYQGTTAVNAGTLVLGGSLSHTSGTTVESGAILALRDGSGTVTLDGNGGNAPNGDLWLKNGATLEILNPGSRLEVDGTGTNGIRFETGSSIHVSVAAGNPAIISSKEAISGVLTDAKVFAGQCDDCKLFEGKTIASAFESGAQDWDFGALFLFSHASIVESGGMQILQFSTKNNPEAFVRPAQTQNQIATAPAANDLFITSETVAPEIYSALSALDGDAQVRELLDQMAGEPLAAFTTAREANAQQFAHALWQRFRASEHQPGWYDVSGRVNAESTPPVSAPPTPQAAGKNNHFVGWAQPFGIFTNNDGRGRASDIKSRIYGLSGGVEHELPGSLGLRVGGALGYARYSIFAETGSQMQGQANTYQAALYGAWQNRHFHIGIAGRYGYTNMRSQRSLSLVDNLKATARFSGQEGGAIIEIGATLGNPTFFTVRPIAAFQYDRLTQGSFRETGASLYSLEVASQDYTSLLTTLGARISKLYPLQGGFGIEPEIRVGWTYQAGDKKRPVVATTYNVPSAVPFTTYGAESDRNAIWVGAGYLMRTADSVRVGLNYDAYIGEYYTQQVIGAELQIIW